MDARRGTAAILAALVSGALLAAGCAHEPGRPNVLLVTLDTTRADRLGCYGYSRETSPALDRLARDGVLYRNAFGVSSWTLPTHASLFTGKYPTTHAARYSPNGALSVVEGPDVAGRDAYRVDRLAPAHETLAELLLREGYATGAVVAGPWLKRVFALDQGFEHYDDTDIAQRIGRRAESVTDAALAWLGGVEGRPFFLFVNYYDPHSPYLPPQGFRDIFLPPDATPASLPRDALLRAMYDAEIRYMDFHLGRLLDHLRERGLYEDTLVVVTADHGELLGEGGRWEHGESLTLAELRIPFLVKLPGARDAGREVDTPVQQVDVVPLVAEELGLALPAGVQGRFPPQRDRPVLAELEPFPTSTATGAWRCLIEGKRKLSRNEQGRLFLHEWERDPAEERDLRSAQPAIAERLEAELLRRFAALEPGQPPDSGGSREAIDPELRRSLEALGYVETQ